ncbi:helix-turn-helix domain-containing protein [Paenibacillus flagellatus]|uniref:Transcriptional regulator n=1 Tax=Paenibacillus flagellatus TaxID=2211139 RepID=A0A2V5JVW7_9BACL|nr:helix-turn-helix transcriptional regulator [Paenibacillus flagellatus]PYI50292.1 transcriptional regulator [Paenibacillus flagellatus]
MKIELGRCLLGERLAEAGISVDRLADALQMRRERLADFMDNKRVMPLKTALSIAATLDCEVDRLYECTRVEAGAPQQTEP